MITDFTEEDREKINDIHTMIVKAYQMIDELKPLMESLDKNPIFRALNFGRNK